MAKEELNSDRINYLIWRYLQETNYPETAVRLQQEWNVENPQALDFAPHVGQHTLVAVLQRGLIYHKAEREFLQTTQGLAPPGFFGPLAVQSSPAAAPAGGEEEAAGDAENANGDVSNPRKRLSEARPFHQNGSASPFKRRKLSNGYEDGPDPHTPMEIDEADRESHVYPSPREVEQPEPELPARAAPPLASEATQIPKVRELAAETTFLPLSGEGSQPVVLHCAWSPRDATLLVSAGTDALARLWTTSRGPSAADAQTQVNGTVAPYPYETLAAPFSASNFTVSAVAWANNGATVALAVETREDELGQITVWNKRGGHSHTFEGTHPPVTKLCWNPSDTLLLALMPNNTATCVKVFHLPSRASLCINLDELNFDERPVDVVWTSDTDFVLCGGQILYAYRCGHTDIEFIRKYETSSNSEFDVVVYDERTQLFATSHKDGMVEVWDSQGLSRAIKAHERGPVGSKWQPLSPTTVVDPDQRLLATSGQDNGIVCLWNVRDAEPKPIIINNGDCPVTAISFTPDGAFIACATTEKILIWKIDDLTQPRASWLKASEPGWQTPLSNNTASEQEDAGDCIAWDANGQRLAYGVSSQLAIIAFRQ